MKQKNKTFQEKLKTLEEIQNAIQNNEEGNLETLVELYEKGLTLAMELEKEVEKYEKKILDIVSAQDNPETEQDSTIQNNEKKTTDNTPKTKTTTTKKLPSQKRKNPTDTTVSLFDE